MLFACSLGVLPSTTITSVGFLAGTALPRDVGAGAADDSLPDSPHDSPACRDFLSHTNIHEPCTPFLLQHGPLTATHKCVLDKTSDELVDVRKGFEGGPLDSERIFTTNILFGNSESIRPRNDDARG